MSLQKMVLGEDASTSKKVKVGEEKPTPKKLIFSALIVDDNSSVRKFHSVILKSCGFKTELATNGKEAADIVRAGANFHIVFMDKEMPIMNGIEATKEMRAMGVKCKIVGVTSCETEAEKEEFMLAGLDVCFTKPLTASMILSVMEDLEKN